MKWSMLALEDKGGQEMLWILELSSSSDTETATFPLGMCTRDSGISMEVRGHLRDRALPRGRAWNACASPVTLKWVTTTTARGKKVMLGTLLSLCNSTWTAPSPQRSLGNSPGKRNTSKKGLSQVLRKPCPGLHRETRLPGSQWNLLESCQLSWNPSYNLMSSPISSIAPPPRCRDTLDSYALEAFAWMENLLPNFLYY